MKNSFFSRWQKTAFLLAAMAAFTGAAYGQANYMSIFGSSGCNICNRVSGQVAPTAFSPISDLTDIFGGGVTSPMLRNSVYDNAGNLLFSANVDGIYSPDGTQQFPFNTSLVYDVTGVCGTFEYDVDINSAVSEICIVPITCKPNSYYVICWCSVAATVTNYNVLRAVEVDIDPATGALSFIDNLLGKQPDCGSDMYNFYQVYTGAFEIAADAVNSDGSRDIYTANYTSVLSSYYTQVLKWHIGSDGTLPVSNPVNMAGTELVYAPATTKAKVIHLPDLGSGASTVLAYSCIGETTLGHANLVETFDLSTTAMATYMAPYTSWAARFQDIWSFEYIPSINEYCFAWTDGDVAANGGIGYATPIPAFGTMITHVASTQHYSFSDLERNKHGDLCMVYDDLGTPAGLGTFAYIPVGALTGSATMATAIASVIQPTSCSGNISVSNVQVYENPYVALGRSWYLGSQIQGENYDEWSSMPYVITGTKTWTPTDNPVQAASGISSVGVINANSIVIQPGGSLTLTDMTIQMAPGSYIDVDNSLSSSSSVGGRLILVSSLLTVNPGGSCSSAGTMWGGVRVWGDPGNSQSPSGGTSYTHQGMLIMNGSTISYAVTGVSLGDIIGSVSNGDGIIQAVGSTFYNDNYGVIFMPYDNFNTAGAMA